MFLDNNGQPSSTRGIAILWTLALLYVLIFQTMKTGMIPDFSTTDIMLYFGVLGVKSLQKFQEGKPTGNGNGKANGAAAPDGGAKIP